MILGVPRVVSWVTRIFVKPETEVYKFSIATASAEIWTIVESALGFLTGHQLTALLLVSYLIKRIGFGMWRTARRSV